MVESEKTNNDEQREAERELGRVRGRRHSVCLLVGWELRLGLDRPGSGSAERTK